jgi:Amino acid permease
VLESVVGSWGATFISVGVIISVQGAYLAWTLINAEVLYVPATTAVMPKFLARKNKNHTPIAALITTNLAVQALLLTVLFVCDALDFMLALDTALSLVPYLFAAGYALKLTITRETYPSTDESERRRQQIIAAAAVLYSIFLLYAAGLKYLLVACIVYAPGTLLYIWARREQGRRVFQPAEAVMCVGLGRRSHCRHSSHPHGLPNALIPTDDGLCSARGLDRRDGLRDRGVSADQVDRTADRVRRIEHGNEDRRDVVARDLPTGNVLAELDATLAWVVGESTGPHHRPVELACPHRVICTALRTQVHAEGVVAGRVGVRPHAADDHVAADPGLLRRSNQLDGAAVVHRLLARRSTSWTGAGGKHHGIAAGDRLRDVCLARVLEVDHRRLRAGLPHVVRVIGIANQRDDLIAPLGQDLGEAQGDLAVASGNGNSHGLKPRPARDASVRRVARLG